MKKYERDLIMPLRVEVNSKIVGCMKLRDISFMILITNFSSASDAMSRLEKNE